MLRRHALKTESGLVLVSAPSLNDWYSVRYLQLEMQKQIYQGQYEGWPPEDWDPILFARFGDYYQAIARFFSFSPEFLDSFQRHIFFIGDRPIEKDGEWQLSLSILDKLLGLDYTPVIAKKSQSLQTMQTTGFEDLDAVVALNLLWKESSSYLSQSFSLQEVCRILEVAGDFLSQQDKDDAIPNPAVYFNELSDNPETEESQEEKDWAIALKNQGFNIPSD